MRNCEYLKPNGEFCGSPALRGRDYCHWHLTCVARRLHAEKQEATQDRTPLELPPLEDANSVQLAVMMVIDAMLRQRIGPRISGQLLYALQIASSNLKQGVCFQPAKPQSEEGKTVRCTQYDALEADFDIAEHAEQLKSTELPMPVRADSGSPDSPWIERYGAVNAPASRPREPAFWTTSCGTRCWRPVAPKVRNSGGTWCWPIWSTRPKRRRMRGGRPGRKKCCSRASLRKACCKNGTNSATPTAAQRLTRRLSSRRRRARNSAERRRWTGSAGSRSFFEGIECCQDTRGRRFVRRFALP